MAPEVSVIVIAYNEERRIAQCLRALLAQDATLSYEVIVVDDGSQDATAAVVEQMARDHQNLRLVHHPVNRGRGAARRSGQDASRAPWIGFVDADVIVPPQWLRRCHDALADADGVSGIAQPDGDCAVLWRMSGAGLRTRPGSAEITGNNLLLSRVALDHVPFSPTARLGEDFRLAKAMTRRGYRLKTIDDLIVEHHETKTYAQGVSWMWASGVDATSLLLEFLHPRLPDLAWVTWLASVCAIIVADLCGVLATWISVVLVCAVTLAVAAAFVYSRFTWCPRPARFVAALALSPPLMTAYLLGRTAGVALSPLRRRRSSPESP